MSSFFSISSKVDEMIECDYGIVFLSERTTPIKNFSGSSFLKNPKKFISGP